MDSAEIRAVIRFLYWKAAHQRRLLMRWKRHYGDDAPTYGMALYGVASAWQCHTLGHGVESLGLLSPSRIESGHFFIRVELSQAIFSSRVKSDKFCWVISSHDYKYSLYAIGGILDQNYMRMCLPESEKNTLYLKSTLLWPFTHCTIYKQKAPNLDKIG